METIRPRNDKLKDRNVANICPFMRSLYKKSEFLSMIEKGARRWRPPWLLSSPLVLIVLPALLLLFGVARQDTPASV
jgi:hypothetical protein